MAMIGFTFPDYPTDSPEYKQWEGRLMHGLRRLQAMMDRSARKRAIARKRRRRKNRYAQRHKAQA
jgi:hypothetical protein